MAQSVEQLICNLQVMGSSPFTSSRKKQKALTENSVRAFLFMGFSLLSAWQARNKKPPAMRVETIRYTHKNTFPLR